jgi:hypothetical protein
MSSQKITKAQTLAKLQALIAGTQKHTPNGQFTLGNAAYTTSSLVQLLGSLVAAMTAQNTADATAKDALLAVSAADAKVKPIVSAYRKYLLATYGNAVQILDDYGLTPAKAPKPLTVEAMSAKVAQNQATRKARGSVGPKKRSEIKGTVEVKAEQVSAQPAAAPPKTTA